MNVYQLINTPPNLAVFVKLYRNDIIKDASIIQQIHIYDRFYELEGNKTERYKKLSQEFKLSSKTIQRIITKLNKKAK